MSVEKEGIAQLLGGELSRKAQDFVMVGGMGLWWMQGENNRSRENR